MIEKLLGREAMLLLGGIVIVGLLLLTIHALFIFAEFWCSVAVVSGYAAAAAYRSFWEDLATGHAELLFSLPVARRDHLTAKLLVGLGSIVVLAVLPGLHELCAIDEQAVVALAHGVSRVLAHYWRCGFSTFNMTLFADACGSEEAAFPVHLRLICRQNVSPDYRTDDYFMQKLLGEELMLTTPEELAEGLRQGWEG